MSNNTKLVVYLISLISLSLSVMTLVTKNNLGILDKLAISQFLFGLFLIGSVLFSTKFSFTKLTWQEWVRILLLLGLFFLLGFNTAQIL